MTLQAGNAVPQGGSGYGNLGPAGAITVSAGNGYNGVGGNVTVQSGPNSNWSLAPLGTHSKVSLAGGGLLSGDGATLDVEGAGNGSNSNAPLSYGGNIKLTAGNGNGGLDGGNVTLQPGSPNGGVFAGGVYGVATAITPAVAVVIDSAGQLGTISSSERFKKDIKPMDKTSEAILRLKPVSFQYKSDSKATPQFGLIAEEVEKVNADLVVREADGKVYSVRYEAVNAMLLNEFLKEHRAVQELRSTVQKQENDFQSKLSEQQKQIEALTTGLQKVGAELELQKPPARTVVNKQ